MERVYENKYCNTGDYPVCDNFERAGSGRHGGAPAACTPRDDDCTAGSTGEIRMGSRALEEASRALCLDSGPLDCPADAETHLGSGLVAARREGMGLGCRTLAIRGLHALEDGMKCQAA